MSSSTYLDNLRETLSLVEEVLREVEAGPDVGSLVLYVGVVKRVKDGRRVRVLRVEVTRDFWEAVERLRQDGVVVKVREGELRPGEPILVIAVSGRTRHEAIEKMARAVDLVKRSLVKVEEYLE